MVQCLSRAYSPPLPLVKESKIVLDSGFQAEDSGFQLLDSGFVVSGTWIPDYSHLCFPKPWILDSKSKDFQGSGLHKQRFLGFRPTSRFCSPRRHLSTSHQPYHCILQSQCDTCLLHQLPEMLYIQRILCYRRSPPCQL